MITFRITLKKLDHPSMRELITDLKLAMISPTYGREGGVARHVWQLCRKLRERGHDISAFSTANVPHIPVSGMKNASFAFFSSFRTAFRKFDAVHCHNPLTIPPSWPSRKHKTVLTLHGIWSEQIEYIHWYGKAFSWLESALTGTVDAITCVSKRGAEHYGGVWIPNAIEPSDFPKERIRLKNPQIAFLGRPSKEKGVTAIGELPKDLRSSVVFIYGKPWKEAMRILAGSDMLLLPSVMEGCPTAMLEALFLGVPVLTRKIPETCDVGGTCAHYFSDDRELPDRANYLLEHIGEARDGVRKYRDKLLARFTWDVVVEEYLKVYE